MTWVVPFHNNPDTCLLSFKGVTKKWVVQWGPEVKSALFLSLQLCLSATFTSSPTLRLTSVSHFQERRNPSLKPWGTFLARRRRKSQKVSQKGKSKSRGFPVAVWSQRQKSQRRSPSKRRQGKRAGAGAASRTGMSRQVAQSGFEPTAHEELVAHFIKSGRPMSGRVLVFGPGLLTSSLGCRSGKWNLDL